MKKLCNSCKTILSEDVIDDYEVFQIAHCPHCSRRTFFSTNKDFKDMNNKLLPIPKTLKRI